MLLIAAVGATGPLGLLTGSKSLFADRTGVAVRLRFIAFCNCAS